MGPLRHVVVVPIARGETVEQMERKRKWEEWKEEGERKGDRREWKKRTAHGRLVGCTVFTCRRSQVAVACVLRCIRFADFLVDGQTSSEDFIVPLKFMNVANSRTGQRRRIYRRRVRVPEIYRALYMYVGPDIATWPCFFLLLLPLSRLHRAVVKELRGRIVRYVRHRNVTDRCRHRCASIDEVIKYVDNSVFQSHYT